MFLCERCGKGYQTQSSLGRHLQNHSIGNSAHFCPTCDVMFSRRDLLMRHMQIHRDSGSKPGFPPSRAPGGKTSSRRRCHTACQPCRAARVKCNGEQPCLTCRSNARDCRYSPRHHRVSRVMGPETLDTTTGNQPKGDSHAPEERPRNETSPRMVQPATFPLTPVEFPPCGNDQPVPPCTSDAQTALNSSDDTLISLPEMGAVDNLDFSLAVGSSGDAISWPWFHESLYLQDNPLNEWFEPVLNYPIPSPGCINRKSPGMEQTGVDIVSFPRPPELLPLAAEDPETAGGSGIRDTHGDVQPSKNHYSWSPAQEHLVAELVSHSTRPETESKNFRACYWFSMSLRVTETFDIGNWQAVESEPVLTRLLKLYKQHFSPLWPLLSNKGFEPAGLHRLLFLTLASIGAMYGNPQERCFGTALHEEIRKVLVTPLFSLEEREENIIPLGQARLLTQVAALYFGQRRAFSYAQYLGAITVAQARRMDLFASHKPYFNTSKPSYEEQVAAWMNLEARKRLAFGILRADVYASVLLNSRPLLSPEEISIDLPVADHIWHAPDESSIQEFMDHTKTPGVQGRNLPFCDLVRITFDRSEALLDMEPSRYELLLFGMQEPVWRFSHDPNLFYRLTGNHEPPISAHESVDPYRSTADALDRPSSPSRTDQLGVVRRRMNDLRDDRHQLHQALRKWEQSFVAVRTTNQFQNDRTSIMSSLLLFKISYLRLTAPIADLHSVAYALSNKRPVERRKLQMLTLWAHGRGARVAADSACQIWTLLDSETKRPTTDRAKHNLLAFSGLHHAAVLLWVLAGSQEDNHTPELSLPALTDGEPISLCRRQSTKLMRNIVGLYKLLTPVGWCSFATAAEHLSLHTFPATTSNMPGTFSYDNE